MCNGDHWQITLSISTFVLWLSPVIFIYTWIQGPYCFSPTGTTCFQVHFYALISRNNLFGSWKAALNVLTKIKIQECHSTVPTFSSWIYFISELDSYSFQFRRCHLLNHLSFLVCIIFVQVFADSGVSGYCANISS